MLVTIIALPSNEIDGKVCGCAATRMASTAVCTLPSVAFLKPTGADSADAICRCSGLSTVRAPIAPQLSSSA